MARKRCELCGRIPGFREILVRYAGIQGEICDPCATKTRREEEELDRQLESGLLDSVS